MRYFHQFLHFLLLLLSILVATEVEDGLDLVAIGWATYSNRSSVMKPAQYRFGRIPTSQAPLDTRSWCPFYRACGNSGSLLDGMVDRDTETRIWHAFYMYIWTFGPSVNGFTSVFSSLGYTSHSRPIFNSLINTDAAYPRYL